MKLTTPENIKTSEKDFIDTINAELDWDAIEKLLMEKHNFTLQDEVIYKDGDLIIHQDQIAYKFDFDIKVPLSVIFNRNGECLDISSQREFNPDAEADLLEGEEPLSDDAEAKGPDHSLSDEQHRAVEKTASELADMISEINEGGE